MKLATFGNALCLYDPFSTPTNLHKWGLRKDPLFKRCGEKVTMTHIMPGCISALTQGRYSWRHGDTTASRNILLQMDCYWDMAVDLGGRLQFSQFVQFDPGLRRQRGFPMGRRV